MFRVPWGQRYCLSAALSASTDRARAALLGTLGEMCRVAGDAFILHIAQLLPKLLSWANSGRIVEIVINSDINNYQLFSKLLAHLLLYCFSTLYSPGALFESSQGS